MGRALSTAGELAGVCSLSATDDESDAPPGAVAPISLNCGNPMGLMVAHRMGQHSSHWLLLAPNSDGLPKGFAETLLEPSKVLPNGMLTGGLLAPSAWAASVLRRCFSDTVPVVVCPHGVTPAVHTVDQIGRDAARRGFRAGSFDVLHMTSTEAERKGTRSLLAAWKKLKDKKLLPAVARLYVVMNPTQLNKIRWWCADLGLTDLDVGTSPGLMYEQSDIAAMYGSMHVICQPSRAEGFGLVPLESLACGVPIVATACTGHSEYLGSRPPGAVIVEHGDLAPMDDFPGSVAPSVSADAICSALERAFGYWETVAAQAEMNAAAIAREWSWENKSVPGIRRMLQETRAKEST
jgi:glycosyltransferase involved in cell wall biosynthesis